MSDTVDIDTAADRIGCTRRWLAEEARAKRVPHIRIGRYYRFTPADITAILAQQHVDPEVTNEFAPTGRSQASRRSA